jgi:hypothetical protein
MNLDALTRDLSPRTQDLLAELRSLVVRTIPAATEKVNLGWKSLNFSHPNAGYFCGLFPVDDRVIAAFEFGVLAARPGREPRCPKLRQAGSLRPLRSGSGVRRVSDLPRSLT